MSQQLEDNVQVGWNTFSNRGLNFFVHPKFRLEFSLIYLSETDENIYEFGFNVGQSSENPPWHLLHKDKPGLGKCEVLERDRNLAYARINYIVPGGKLNVVCSNRYFDNIVLKCSVEGNISGKFYFLGQIYEESKIRNFQLSDKGIVLGSDIVQGFIRVPDKESTKSFFNSIDEVKEFISTGQDNGALAQGKYVLFPLKEKESYLSILTTSKDIKMSQSISKFVGSEQHIINSNKTLYEKYSTKLSVDHTRELDIGILAPIYWNLSYDYDKKIPYVPVSKSWVSMMEEIMETGENKGDGPLIFNWDAAFAAMSLVQFDTVLAKDLIMGLLAHQKKDGSIPHLIVNRKKTNLINPPIIFLTCMKIFLYSRNYKFLKDVFPKLDSYFHYLMDHRTGNESYRMAYGAPSVDKIYPNLCEKTGAAYESGMNDSPAWSEAEYDPETGTMDINSVGFTSIMCLSASIMNKIAINLNQNTKANIYAKHNNKFRRSLLNYFFNNEKKIFSNRKFNDEFSDVLTPDIFFPLLTGKMGKRFVDGSIELLEDQKKFKNTYMIPSLSKDHPEYDPDGDYWCGRIWPPLNYLVHLALSTQNRSVESFELAYNSFMMFYKEYDENGHVHENLSAFTGRGEPQEGTYARSCPMYSWGNLMGLMLLEEIFNVDWNLRLHFGCFYLKNEFDFHNIKVGNIFYSVYNTPEITMLKKNQNDFISATPAARFLEFKEEWDSIKFKLLGNGKTEIKLSQLGERFEVYVRVNNKPAHYINMPRKAPVSFEINCDPVVPKNITIFIKR